MRILMFVGVVLVGLCVVGGTGSRAEAQVASTLRPVPAPVVAPAYFTAAVERGTRNLDGSPGASYWTNWSRYDIDARLDPATARLEGAAVIKYENRSPFTLNLLVLHLHQNLHKPGAPRNDVQEVTDGIELTRVAVGGEELSEALPDAGGGGPGYRVEGTIMTIRPESAVESGDTVTIELAWATTLPANGAGRMGHSNHEMYLVAYWFPKMAVFDDLRGWDAQPYLSNAEFYDSFGDYDVSLTVPTGWTVMATGELQNGSEVYAPATIGRLEQAAASDERVVVASAEDLSAGLVTAAGQGSVLTYRFLADSVRDFTWTTSNVQRWDATSAVVPDRTGDGVDDRVLIQSFWRQARAPLWDEQWRYGKQAIEHHSRYTGLVYPWPHMTMVEGTDIIGGGMEFPMMTLIGSYEGRGSQDLFNVTAHEIGHMWIPMIVGTNEKRYAWMDEGSTTFLEAASRMSLFPGVDHFRLESQDYVRTAAMGQEQSMMRHGDYYEPGPGYVSASYSKPAALMAALREMMGADAWGMAYRTFVYEWAYKHPTPWDFFDTFERFAERDLDWFWTTYYYETWALDFDVAEVTPKTGGGAVVRVLNRGLAPYPATVRIFTTGSGLVEESIPVEHWLAGNRDKAFDIPPAAGAVTRVEIDPVGYAPDTDRANNFWPRGS